MNDIKSLSGDEIVVLRNSELNAVVALNVKASVKEAFNEIFETIRPQGDSSEEIPIDLREGAELLGIALPTMYSKISRREFSSFKRGKKVYVLKSELLSYLKSGKRKSREEIVKAA